MLAFPSRLFGVAPQRHVALVSVYQRGDALLLDANNQVEAGFRVETDRVIALPVTVSAAELGAAILTALATSRTGVQTPPPGHAPLDEPLWRAAGARTRRAFMTGTRLCSIAREGATLTVTATVNGGPSGEGRGWRPLDGGLRTLPAAAEPAALGTAVEVALAESVSWPTSDAGRTAPSPPDPIPKTGGA